MQNQFNCQIFVYNYMKKQKARPKQIYLQRIKCDCMGQKHELINNCLNCGKIVCAQQGEGNCLYCGSKVTRPDGLYIDDTLTLFPSLSPEQHKAINIERSRAVQHKNKLVERDKSQNQQQNIFDEQVDYYQISENKWLDQEDRKHAVDKILEKGNLIETQQFKVNAKYDALTGEFVRQEFQFDDQAFKKEGQTFLEKREMQEKLEKERKAKERHNWDQRLLRSEKLKDLCSELINNKNQRVSNQAKSLPTKAITELVLEKDE